MRGDRQILRERVAGFMPKAVFVNVGYADLRITNKYDDPENGMQFGLLPTVELPASKLHRAHDFRFLVNCRVHVHGPAMDEDFCRIVEQIAEKAWHVIAYAGDEMMEFKNGKWEAWTF
jgi:hypothetical protein